jgi:hypothetical protein
MFDESGRDEGYLRGIPSIRRRRLEWREKPTPVEPRRQELFFVSGLRESAQRRKASKSMPLAITSLFNLENVPITVASDWQAGLKK